jgi:hypothetical protein
MAKAYLGKISALVTANTSDFNSKLNASAQQVGNFARAMQTQLTRAETSATASLRGIYTESQKVSRALQAAASQRLQFKGYDTSTFASLTKAISQFKSLQAAAVAVNEPLSRAARAVEKLSAPVQLGFDPALKSAQKSAEYLSAALARGGVVGERSFERIERRALAAAQAADRLAEAAQMASAGPRGTELAFAAPRVRDSLAASADVRQRAAAAPASVLEGGRVANDVQKLVAIDNLIQKRRAEIESGTILNIDTTRAQASLESLLQIAARVRAQVNAAIGGGGADAETASLIARARAQRDYYEESERLANQAASDAAAPLIARARAEREFYEESRRLASQAAADAAAPLIARAQAEREFYEESERLRRQAAADSAATADREVAPLINRARAERDSQLDFGLDLDAPKRQIEIVRGSIVSLKAQIDTLPAGFRTEFIPAVVAAQNELESLAASPGAAEDAIERLRLRVTGLSNDAEVTSRKLTLVDSVLRGFGGGGVEGIKFGMDDRAVQGYIAQLSVLQGIMAGISGPASDALAAGFEAVRGRIASAASDSSIRLKSVREEIDAMVQSLANVAAKAAGVNASGLTKELQRVGDVGRAGLDRWSLAIQQAGFAVDDFFSATGGLDQRIRAVSNNITQLAFILGGTKGLWIGIAAVIAGQAVLALNKWINSGRTAEDQTKALNSALSRQQSIVDDLKQAFDQLADSMSRGTMSRDAEKALNDVQAIEKILKRRGDLAADRTLESDPEAQRLRADIAKGEREREAASTFGGRVAAQAAIDAATSRLADVERTVRVRPAPDAREVEDAIRRRATAPFRNAQLDLPEGQTPDAIRARRAALEPALDDLRSRMRDAQSDGALGAPRLSILAESYTQLQGLAARLDEALTESSNDAVKSVLEGGLAVGKSLLSVQELLDQATIPYSSIRDEADRIGKELRAKQDELKSGSVSPERDAELSDEVTQLRSLADAAKSAAVSFRQFVDIINKNSKQLSDTVLQEVGDREMQARRNLNSAAAASRLDVGDLFGTDAKASDLSGGVAPSLRSRDVAARLLAGEQAAEDRRRARDELRRATAGEREFQRRSAEAFSQFESDASRGALGDRANQLIAQRDSAQKSLDSGVLGEDRTQEARAELAAATQGLAEIFSNSPIAASLELFSNQLDAAAQQAVEITRRIEAERQSVERGRELSMQPGQREGEELQQQIQDIRNYFDQAVDESTGLPDDVRQLRAQMNEAITRAQEEMARQVAPTIMGAADARMNAVLQGPSRRELTTADIRTDAGSRELSRLLRGDDDAKNADLANLQREANRLLQVIAGKNNPVA